METKKTKKMRERINPRDAAIEYTAALHTAVDTVAVAVKTMCDAGYALSCKVSWGRVMSISVLPIGGAAKSAEVDADAMADGDEA